MADLTCLKPLSHRPLLELLTTVHVVADLRLAGAWAIGDRIAPVWVYGMQTVFAAVLTSLWTWRRRATRTATTLEGGEAQ